MISIARDSHNPVEPTSALNSSRGKPSTALMLSWESGWTTAKPPDTVGEEQATVSKCWLGWLTIQRKFLGAQGLDVRKYCLVAPPSSTISTRPGFSCSMEGTWLARTPISPEAAGMLTWVLWSRRFVSQGIPGRGAGGRRCFKNIHAGRAVDGLSERMQVSPRIQELGGPTGWV